MRYLILALLLSGCATSNVKMTLKDGVIRPIKEYTPGDVMSTDVKEICKSGYTFRVRNVSNELKRKVYDLYGRHSKKDVCCEVDHLINLGIGGSNDIKNLWPQPYSPRPGAHEKDEAEGYLRRKVCSGEIPIRKAQKMMAEDWHKVYQESQESK